MTHLLCDCENFADSSFSALLDMHLSGVGCEGEGLEAVVPRQPHQLPAAAGRRPAGVLLDEVYAEEVVLALQLVLVPRPLGRVAAALQARDVARQVGRLDARLPRHDRLHQHVVDVDKVPGRPEKYFLHHQIFLCAYIHSL